jgi:hypothetical protein
LFNKKGDSPLLYRFLLTKPRSSSSRVCVEGGRGTLVDYADFWRNASSEGVIEGANNLEEGKDNCSDWYQARLWTCRSLA